ncbi:MAG: hypothetical protein SGBAC_012352 [Bacillariaceae sp.]
MTSNTTTSNKDSIPMLHLGEIGIGLMQWGTTKIDERVVNPKGNLSDDMVQQLWKTCRDKKVVFFDTAEGYGGGTSETRVQEVRQWYQDKVLDGKPDDVNVVVATKYLPTLWRWTKGAFYRSLKGSLQRLKVAKIDLYFIHTPVHPLPLEYHIQWACDAMDDGLIGNIGISNCPADLCIRAHKVAQQNGGKRIACNQIMLNLLVWQSAKHRETVRVCQELGIQIIAYSPIGQGLLTDGLTPSKFQGIRAVKMTGVEYGNLAPLRAELKTLSDKYSTTMAQVAINWVRGHGAVPLVGCRDIAQTKDALDSTNFRLKKEEVQKLDTMSLGLSLFERPSWRRNLFVIFISILQMAYSAEIQWTELRKMLTDGTRGTS